MPHPIAITLLPSIMMNDTTPKHTTMRTERWIAIALLLLTLLLIANPINTPFTVMLNSMLVQLSLITIGLGVMALIGQRVQVFMACMIAAAMMSLTLPDYSHAARPQTTAGDTLKVMHFNVLKLNNDHQTILNAVLAQNADVLSFQEVTPAWHKALSQQLSEQYPYHIEHPLQGSFGISLYSKYPLQDAKVEEFVDIPYISGTLLVNGQAVPFVASHTIPPTFEGGLQRRNLLLQHISAQLATINGPKLLIGDMNAVPWDQAIHNLQHWTGLHDSRNNLSPTYPSWLAPARIPIDYIFYGGGITCKSFQVVTRSSSDHLGIAGEYVMPVLVESQKSKVGGGLAER